MASDLDAGRARELEAERLRAFRETARQVAHELKNPLTPIRLAVARLQRDAPPMLRDTVDVLATESARLEEMARSFSQFGRLPEGPAAEVDVGEMARYTTRAAVPSHIHVSSRSIPGCHWSAAITTRSRARSPTSSSTPVDACEHGGSIEVRVTHSEG